MMNFENTEKSLPEKLSDDIVSYILEKEMKPGDKLPNEAFLAKEMGAGRSSLREAMKLLASRNIVTIKQGSGTYIASKPGVVDDPLGFTFINDKEKLVRDLLEIRFLIEPYIAQMAALNATQADIEFHNAIASSSKNLVVPRIVPIINSSIPLFVQVTNRTLKNETIETHREIANAIKNHDAIKAHDAMYLHLVYNRKVINK